MCSTCRKLIELFDKTSLCESGLLLSLERATDPGEHIALKLALANNRREMTTVRQELDDHQAFHRWK